MPPKVEQGTVIVLDIGKNVSGQDEKGPSFFENAGECTSKIIERKILSQVNNYISIILLGSKKTKNMLAEPGLFRHIEVMTELQPPTWQMIRNLPIEPSQSTGDWFESLIVAADHLKTAGVKIASQKIILITNFQSPASLNEDVDTAISGFQKENIEIDILGPDLYDDGLKGQDIELAKQFVESTNGATAPFDYTLRYLLFHKKKAKRVSSWNVDLSIGPNLKIPVSVYIKLKDEPVIKSWSKAIRDPVTSNASTVEGIVKEKVHINVEKQTTVDSDNVVKAYHYGQKLIPFTECDKSMLYSSGDKCLSLYGFTESKNVTWQNLSGDGLSYVYGRKGDTKAEAAIRCIVHCLHEMELVGIVRRVYNNGNAPKMFALMPVIDVNASCVCLSLAGICYKNEIKCMAFPSTNLKKYACSAEQVDAFKDLIKAMDLTKAYDDSFDDKEAFPIAQTVSPMVQYMMDCIAYRAMNPDKPLPQPRDDIMMLFKIPPLIEKKAREPIKKLKGLFSLHKVEVKNRNKRKIKTQIDCDKGKNDENNDNSGDNKDFDPDDMPKIYLPSKRVKTERIGTTDPISDYKALVEAGRDFPQLAQEMIQVIENIILINLYGNYEKGIEVLSFFRTECIKSDPKPYNELLVKLKSALVERNKTEVIDLIVEEKLNFIIKEENVLSSYAAEDCQGDSQLYENDTIPNTDELTLALESDVQNMFDDM